MLKPKSPRAGALQQEKGPRSNEDPTQPKISKLLKEIPHAMWHSQKQKPSNSASLMGWTLYLPPPSCGANHLRCSLSLQVFWVGLLFLAGWAHVWLVMDLLAAVMDPVMDPARLDGCLLVQDGLNCDQGWQAPCGHPPWASSSTLSGHCEHLGRPAGGGPGNPLQYSCLEYSMDRGALAGYSPGARRESDRT